MPKGFVYILECSDGSYYTGSTIDIEVRVKQHQDGRGANYTKKRLPVKLVFLEEFQRIDDAFYREKQLQGWSRVKKEALINGEFNKLPNLSECKNGSHSKNVTSTPLSHQSENDDSVVEQSGNNQSMENTASSIQPNHRGDNGDSVVERSGNYKGNKMKYHSNGKLLLSGEYVVLDGAKAFAVPTKFGQDLEVSKLKESSLIWESFDVDSNCWFQAEFRMSDLRIVDETFDADSDDSKESIAQTLQTILLTAKKMNADFLVSVNGFHVKTHLTFPRNWGLGTSSTLINNIAQWAQIDAFELLNNSFGGSGYDIACAQNNTPIYFQLSEEKPLVTPVAFQPPFADQLFFVYLNIKQNSKKGIQRYRKMREEVQVSLEAFSSISEQMAVCKTIQQFEELLEKHEAMISKIIKNKPIKSILFPDYFGAIKSLGAWGGDFVLATGNVNTPAYFKDKGFETVIPYKDMIIGN